MTDRYYLDEPLNGQEGMLSGPEAHHLIHVMRVQVGQQVTLFDGTGREYTAEVRHVGRTEVKLAILATHDADRELRPRVILGLSLPKGDRQKWLVEKAVELGVSRIVPLRTARSVAQPVRQALDRLQRTVIEASKQCGRNRLLELVEPQDWAEFVAASPDIQQRYLAHPTGTGRSSSEALPSSALLNAPAVVFAVGPEGGFGADETALALSLGWKCVDLGPRILRVETAAIMLAALAAQHQMHVQR